VLLEQLQALEEHGTVSRQPSGELTFEAPAKGWKAALELAELVAKKPRRGPRLKSSL
jgi:hypothetical protein